MERSLPTVHVRAAAPTEARWRDGRVDFVQASLSEVLPVVNGHSPKRIVIDDPRVANLTYSGTVLQAHLDEWIASLPTIYPVRLVPLEDGTATLVMDNTAD